MRRTFFNRVAGILLMSLLVFTSGSCKKDKDKTLAKVVIVSITDVTSTSAKVTTRVTDEGGATVTGTGACWGLTNNPDLSKNVSNVGGGTGTFISNLNSLSPNTTYYVRAFATNEVGTAYSVSGTFTTLE